MSKPASTSRPSDEVAIRSLYQQLMDGWNRGSGEAFAAPFAEDGDLVGFDGTYLKGRQEIISFHQQLLDTYVKGSRLVGKIRNVRFVTPVVPIIHTIGGTIMAGQTGIEPERNSVQTLVATKDSKGEWYLTAFQNTRAQYFGRPEQSRALEIIIARVEHSILLSLMSLSGTKIKDNQAVLMGSIDGPAIRYEDSQIRRDAKGRLFYSSSRRLTKEACCS